MIKQRYRDVLSTALSPTDRRPRFFFRTGDDARRTAADWNAKGPGFVAPGLHRLPVHEAAEPKPPSYYPYAVVLDEVRETVPVPADYPDANPKAAIGARKARLHLVPPALTVLVSDNMGDGADKYGPYNWRSKPVSVSTYIGAIARHLAAYADGEDVDPESATGATHLGAVGACVGILADAEAHGTLVDDRVKGPAAGMIRARTKKVA